MRDQEKDQDLRGVFRHLREEDRQRIPEFKTLMVRAREEGWRSEPELDPRSSSTRPFPRKWAWGGSLLAAAAAALLLLVQFQGTSDSEFERVVRAFSIDPASGAWKSPTDALLDVQGAEILSSVPSISVSRLLSLPQAQPPKG